MSAKKKALWIFLAAAGAKWGAVVIIAIVAAPKG